MSRSSVLLLTLLLSACAQQPSRSCEPTRTLYVVSHGWHSGIVLESGDLVERLPALAADIGREGHVEIGWGEERFYQAREPTVVMALRAVLWRNASALQVVPFAGPPGRYFASSQVAEVRTDEAGYSAALAFVAGTFKGVERLGPSLYGKGWFYRAEGAFHLFNTCNSWVAEALQKASCR